MERSGWLVGMALVGVALAGCGSAQAPATPAGEQKAADKGTPDQAVAEFLEAVRVGNEEKAGAMLTELARKKTQEFNMTVAPPGSETAAFEVGEVELVAEGSAHVACKWTDIGDNKKPHTDEIVWILRQETQGWRIAGMATRIFDNELPLLLNFEDPEDMVRKQEMAEAEMMRRTNPKVEQAKQPAPPADTLQK